MAAKFFNASLDVDAKSVFAARIFEICYRQQSFGGIFMRSNMLLYLLLKLFCMSWNRILLWERLGEPSRILQ